MIMYDVKVLVAPNGRFLIDVSRDRRAKSFLIKRISLCIQRENSASVLESKSTMEIIDEFF